MLYSSNSIPGTSSSHVLYSLNSIPGTSSSHVLYSLNSIPGTSSSTAQTVYQALLLQHHPTSFSLILFPSFTLPPSLYLCCSLSLSLSVSHPHTHFLSPKTPRSTEASSLSLLAVSSPFTVSLQDALFPLRLKVQGDDTSMPSVFSSLELCLRSE